MKKIFKPILSIMLASVVVLSFNSCKKDDKKAVKPELGSAKVFGIVDTGIDPDLSNTNTTERVSAEGIVVIARTNAGNLVTNPASYTYPFITVQTTVQSDGTYTLDLPVGDEAVTYEIQTQDKIYTTKDASGAPARTIYSGISQNITVIKNAQQVLDF